MTKTQDRNLFYLFFVCLVTALGGFLFGFDTAVISGTVGFVKAQFALDAFEEGWFVAVALLGCIIGVAFSGSWRTGSAARRRCSSRHSSSPPRHSGAPSPPSTSP